MSSLWSGTDFASRYEIASKFDHLPLQNWGLSSRVLNALLSYNFKMTVGDVIRASESLATLNGLGEAGVKELNSKVSQLLAETHKNIKAEFSINQCSMPFNSEASLDPLPKQLPQYVLSSPLDQLHLDLRTHGVLVKAGITTIGELFNASNSFLSDIKGSHLGSLGNVNSCFVTFINSINLENNVNWFQYWTALGIQILPSTLTSTSPSEQIIKELPKIIEEILRREDGERLWVIVQRRFSIGKAEKLTLEDMANAYGISRERIRQLEEKALKILGKVLVEQQYAGRRYHIHPAIHVLFQKIHDFIEAEPSKLILETSLFEFIGQTFNIEPEKVKSSLFLILSLMGIQRIEFDYPNAVPVWGYDDPVHHKLLQSGIKRLDDLLTRETSLPYTEFDILVQLNKKAKKAEKLTPTQLSWLIDLCNSVERREDSSIWGKFEYLKGRGNQVERLLAETGLPTSVADLAREINHRLVPLGQRKIVEQNLGNQIIEDNRFVAIGHSGKWGIKSWSNIDTKSILTLMEQYFIIQNKPATAEDIYTYVSERRPVSKNSIIMYLATEKERFAKFSLTTWGLAKWSNTTNSDTWNAERVADFVANIFKTNKAKELDYQVIKQALIDEAGVSAKQAQGLLAGNPVMKSHRGTKWSERRAVYQSNYKDVLAQAKTKKRQKANLRQLLNESVRSILEAAPDKQILLSDLRKLMQKQLGIAESTFTNYINQMDFVERIDIPNSSKKICRLKERQFSSISTRRGSLRQEVSESVRSILETTPDKQMSLAELIVRLRRDYYCPKSTLYRYIGELDYIEQMDLPNSHAKLCRLKNAPELGVVMSEMQDYIDELIQQVRELQTGDGKAYEGIIKNILEICFRGEFDFNPFKVQEQVKTYNGRRIRDFIIDNRNPKMEFWRDLKHVRRVEKILFDAKNYKDPIVYSEISSTLRYLHRNKAFGNFIIIISRRGVNDREEFIEAYSDHDEVVLFLNDEDLITMINLKKEGKSPTSLIEQKYHEFLSQK